ncbi:dihydrodipicolinate synthase family protein [Xanthobacter sp. KR7-225]|uniref:dihydrodipicolinate synthase family protein n=1 Tax=Xanthobacter sp. KR7-225 TaxID=3156613 RepID=UPI0032B46DED
MTRRAPESFRGIYASIVCPMRADGSVDEAALAAHAAAVAGVPGMAGLLVNGHAGENALLTREEARGVLRAARRAAPGARIVAGINAEASQAAAALAQDAEAEGADAVMVFAPFSWALGADRRTIVRHHQTIAGATGLPLFLFQGSVWAGRLAYDAGTLEALLALPAVVAIKEGSWETSAHEVTCRIAGRCRPDVLVMASGDEHLLSTFMLGSAGSLVSLAAVAPELVVALDRAVTAQDFGAALACHRRLTPLAEAIYRAPPPGLVAARLKACLHLLGALAAPACRPPVGPLSAAEMAALAEALEAAGLPPAKDATP